MIKMNKEKRRSSDVVTDLSSNITGVCWKDNKLLNTIFNVNGKQPSQ